MDEITDRMVEFGLALVKLRFICIVDALEHPGDIPRLSL